MKSRVCAFLLLCLSQGCAAQVQPGLCPRHIETPLYPEIARMARLAGKVVVALTIDASGNVEEAKVMSHQQSIELLESYTLSNVRHWTFAKPPTAPFLESLTYDYKLDTSSSGGGDQVSFDLPDRVTIESDLATLQTTNSRNH